MPTITHLFESHKRIQNGVLISHDYVQRCAILEYDSTGRNVIISIMPTLSPKEAHFVKDENNILYYQGNDPDYRFAIETWSDNNTIKRLSIFRDDINLEIQYLSNHQDAM
ncbi:MAG: hypothetical protein ACI30H_06475 [Paludibacteraceae bacterium]